MDELQLLRRLLLVGSSVVAESGLQSCGDWRENSPVIKKGSLVRVKAIPGVQSEIEGKIGMVESIQGDMAIVRLNGKRVYCKLENLEKVNQ